MVYKSYLIEQNINSVDKNIFLFYGENLGLQTDFKNKIKLLNKDKEIVRFNQDDIIKNTNIFFNELTNISLFQKEKIYFIDQSNDKILELIKEIEPKIDQSKLYLFSDVLDKRSKLRSYFEKSENAAVVACYLDNEITIKKIILDKLKNFNGLSSQNINMIINSSNLDRSKLNNELTKIISYFTDLKIDTEKLEILLDLRINENFNILKDEALNGNRVKTNKLLSDTIIDTEKNVFYLSLINQRLSKLAEACELSKVSNITSVINMMKPPIFWKDKPILIEQAKKWNLDKIKIFLNKTYELEIQIKSNPIVNKNVLIKNLLIDICEMANAS